jgi:hypothetical protein
LPGVVYEITPIFVTSETKSGESNVGAASDGYSCTGAPVRHYGKSQGRLLTVGEKNKRAKRCANPCSAS